MPLFSNLGMCVEPDMMYLPTSPANLQILEEIQLAEG